MGRLLPLWVLLPGLIRAAEPGRSAPALAEAIRLYFDEGAPAALPAIETLAARAPGWRDAAWWQARCLLDLGRPAEALEVLGDGGGEHVPAWRFDALRAQAELLTGDAATALARGSAAVEALGSEPPEEPLAGVTRLLVAALAARSGDDGVSLREMLRPPDLPPAIDLPAALYLAMPEADAILAAPLAREARLPGPLLFQARGAWWRLEAGGGLARRVAAPLDDVRECPGPDLCRADGAPVLTQPGVRFTPFVDAAGLWYAAGREPLDAEADAPGLFAWEGGTATPSRLSRAPEGALDHSPTPGPGGAFFFLRRTQAGTRLHRMGPDGDVEALAPDLCAIGGVTLVGDMLILGGILAGRGELRALPAAADPTVATQPLLDVPLEAFTPRAPGAGANAPR